MKQRRTPVLGDDQYGSNKWNRQLIHGHMGANRKESASQVRTLLHAYETQFTHPVTGERLSVRAPLPPDISTLINRIAMKNLCASSALPLFFYSTNRSEDQLSVRRVSQMIPDALRDSDQMIESRESQLHRKLLGVVNKTSGFLQGNTDILYAGLQRSSDLYKRQHEGVNRVRKVVRSHGYVGSKGFYVAEDSIAPALAAAKQLKKRVNEDEDQGEVDLDEVWGVYEEDEGGRDGHRVHTGEPGMEFDESDFDEAEEDGGGFVIEEMEEEEGEEEGKDLGYEIIYEGDDDDADEDQDGDEDEDGEADDEREVFEVDEGGDDDDWNVDMSTHTHRSFSSEHSRDNSDEGDEDGSDAVDFSAVKHWR